MAECIDLETQCYLKIMTWNLNGTLHTIKQGAVLRAARKANPDVLLHETHLVGNRCPFLARMNFTKVLHAGFHRGFMWVAMLLRAHVPLKITQTWHDRFGKFVAITGLL